MARKATSIKGETVDFDLLELKRTIGDKPISADVKNREDFVYSKRKRGSKRAVQKMIQNPEPSKPEVKETPKEIKVGAKPEVKAEKKTVTKKKATKRKIIKKK